MKNNLSFASGFNRLWAVALAGAATTAIAGSTVVIVNMDGPGEGFNDPTVVAPVGGNTGTTLGEQRLNAFQHAAGIWGAMLDSAVEIRVQASFDPLPCTPTSGTLGAAGAITIFANFPGAPRTSTWYPVALANRLAGVDLAPGAPGTESDDIVAFLNSSLDNASCLGAVGWYYGLDNNHGADIDLVTVLLHEFGHGLGFANFVNESTGSQILGLPDHFSSLTLDTTTGKTWDQMTNPERQASAINSRKVTWTGSAVTQAAPLVLEPGTPLLNVTAPSIIAGSFAVGAAAFGPSLATPISGQLALAQDGTSPTTDACQPIINAAAIAGKIAVVDRGACGFVDKVKNAQNAGAIGVIVVDNVAGSPPPGLGGTDPSITIPSVRVSLADGNLIKANLADGVTATMGVDLSVRAGTHANGQVLLNAPNPVQPGSSISHWDPITFPNQLMEPAINSDLTHSVDVPKDLSLALMRDIGWFPDADLDGVADSLDCEPNSDFAPTVVIGTCDSGVANPLFVNGCTLKDMIDHILASSRNHGQFVSGVAHLTNALKSNGLLTAKEKAAIQRCAARRR